MRLSLRALVRKLRALAPGAGRLASLGREACQGLCRFAAKKLAHGTASPPGLRTGRRSLRFRLSLFFAVFLFAFWSLAAVAAWKESREAIDEFFDTQQMLFAKSLAAVEIRALAERLPDVRAMLPHGGKQSLGHHEEDALAFAVYTMDGLPVMNDGNRGQRFPFMPGVNGFVNTAIMGDKDPWRLLWLDSLDGKHRIAVGQELDFRQDMALEMLGEQIVPWLLLVPVLLGGLILLLTRELAPLHIMAGQVQRRQPGDATLLDAESVPLEVRPLVSALNGLITRTNAMFSRERAFISDAAHELRTPLAGLRIQAQVAAREESSPATRQEALRNMITGIDRSSRLIEQLLALSRLEALNGQKGAEGTNGPNSPSGPGVARTRLDWAALLHEPVQEYRPRAERRNITLETRLAAPSSPAHGDPTLISLLVRNILDNAVAYTPEGGSITISLHDHSLSVANDAPYLPKEDQERLGERFFRPPGQSHPGSGLGLSIIQRIAEIHGFTLTIERLSQRNLDIFRVNLSW